MNKIIIFATLALLALLFTPALTLSAVSSLPNFANVSSVSDLFTSIVNAVMKLALMFAVVMIIWSGFMFITAQGEEAKIKKARQNLIYTLVGVIVIILSTELANYINELLGGTASSLIEKIKSPLNQFIALLFTLATVYFIWGIIEYIKSAGDEAALKKGKAHMIYGIIGMAVMASAFGIVAMLQESFGF